VSVHKVGYFADRELLRNYQDFKNFYHDTDHTDRHGQNEDFKAEVRVCPGNLWFPWSVVKFLQNHTEFTGFAGKKSKCFRPAKKLFFFFSVKAPRVPAPYIGMQIL
jgi:hypothetical protein